LSKDDVEDLQEWTPDRRLYKYWGKNPGKADLNPELLFAKDEKPTKSFHWGIEHKTDKKVIGDLWIYLIENDRMAKVAIRVSGKYHHRGIGTEALKTAIAFCFEKTELKRIWSDVHVDNIASCKMLEKCGFIQEGKIRQGKMVSTFCDYYIYGVLKEEYE
jgi:ribosomal-protein-alanine N-acetyltransferase